METRTIYGGIKAITPKRKVLDHLKMKIMSLMTHPHVFPSP